MLAMDSFFCVLTMPSGHFDVHAFFFKGFLIFNSDYYSFLCFPFFDGGQVVINSNHIFMVFLAIIYFKKFNITTFL